MPGRKRYSRVMLKLSGEALLGSRKAGIDPVFTRTLAEDIKRARAACGEMGITIGGGNFFRGTAAEEHGMDRATGDAIGMLATVMNALALQSALEHLNVPTHIQSAIAMEEIAETYVRRIALEYLAAKDIVIFAAGTGDSHFSTDMAAVLRALQLNCDVVLKGTSVDGVYTKDPRKHAGVKILQSLKLLDAVEDPHITVFDNSALTLCADHGLPIVIFNMTKPGLLQRAVRGEDVGTVIH
jgi:uridylate kinase